MKLLIDVRKAGAFPEWWTLEPWSRFFKIPGAAVWPPLIARNPACQHLFLGETSLHPFHRNTIFCKSFRGSQPGTTVPEAPPRPRRRSTSPQVWGVASCCEVKGCEGQDHTSILFCCSPEVSLPDFIPEIRHIKVFVWIGPAQPTAPSLLELNVAIPWCLLPVVNHPPGQHHSPGRQATVAILKRNGGEVWSNNQTSRPSDFRIPSHYFIWKGEEIGRNSLLLLVAQVLNCWVCLIDVKFLLAKAVSSCGRNAFTCLRGSSCLSWTQGGSQLHSQRRSKNSILLSYLSANKFPILAIRLQLLQRHTKPTTRSPP